MEKTVALFLILFLLQPSAHSQSRPVAQGDGINVNIAPFARVPPTKTIQVSVTTTPSPLPSGYSVSLACETDADTTGSATVSPSSISGSTTITITGGTQSWGSGDNPAPNNIKLIAKISGHTADSEDFTVCAHPTNLCNTLVSSNTQYGLDVNFVWTSDSCDCGHLDKCRLAEKLLHSIQPNPPFQLPNGQDLPESGGEYTLPPNLDEWINGALCTHIDHHLLYPIYISHPVVAGSFSVAQTYQFICPRCGLIDWQALRNYNISVEIYDSDSSSENTDYHLKMEKTGCGGPFNSDEHIIMQ